MTITWYSLKLAADPRPEYDCDTERHEDQGIEATWVEQFLDLDAEEAHRIWYTCEDCHQLMKEMYDKSQEE